MQTIMLKLPTLDRAYQIRGLSVDQAALVKITVKGDRMKTVIGLLAQGVIDPPMTIQGADQFCISHAAEAAQIAAEIIKLTVGK